MTQTLLTKMSMKTIGAKPERAKVDGKSVALARIYGIANSLIYKADSKTGDIQIALSGNFEALNLETGEVYRAGVLWMPGGIQELIIGGVDTGDKDANGKPTYNPVKFALEISSTPASNPIGYSYTAKQLVDATINDPLDDLRSALPALAAPSPATASQSGGEKEQNKK